MGLLAVTMEGVGPAALTGAGIAAGSVALDDRDDTAASTTIRIAAGAASGGLAGVFRGNAFVAALFATMSQDKAARFAAYLQGDESSAASETEKAEFEKLRSQVADQERRMQALEEEMRRRAQQEEEERQ